MKRLLWILIFISLGHLFADGVSTLLSETRKHYLRWEYGPAMRKGVSSINAMFQMTMSNMAAYVPEFKDHQVINTNMHYEFSGGDGYFEYSYHLAKTMTNMDNKVILSIINSPAEVERYYSLSISYDFLENTGKYKKEILKRQGIEYEYLQEGNTVYLIFIFDKDEDTEEIHSGMLVRMWVDFNNKTSKFEKDKKIRAYLYELMGILRWKNLRTMLK